MIGYRGELEFVGKLAARLDDAANWLPARLAGLLLLAVAALRRTAPAAWAALRTQRRPSPGPNKLWTIAPMAGALGVQLEKRGFYAVGPGSRPLAPPVIGEAIAMVWTAGGASIAAAAGLSRAGGLGLPAMNGGLHAHDPVPETPGSVNAVMPGIAVAIDEGAVHVTSEKQLAVLSSATVGGGLGSTRHIINMQVADDYDSSRPADDLWAFATRRGVTESFVGLMTAAETRRTPSLRSRCGTD